MNEIVNQILLAGDKFMPQMHLRQLGFRYNACGPFTKNKEKIKKIKETGVSRYIYHNELDRACFQHDMAYGDFKNLTRRTASSSKEAASSKYCVMKHLILVKIQSMVDMKWVLLQWFINFLIKKLLLRVTINLQVKLLKMKI